MFGRSPNLAGIGRLNQIEMGVIFMDELKTLEEKLTEKEEYRVVIPKSQKDQNDELKKLEDDIREMENSIPTYRGEVNGEDYSLNNKEWNEFNRLKFVWKDSRKLVNESKGVILELLDLDLIEKMN